MNSKSEFFNVRFFLSGLWRSRKRCVLRPLALLLLLGGAQAAFATPNTPTGDFIDNKDGTVTHKTTGLTWMRCMSEQQWTGSSCYGRATHGISDKDLVTARWSFAGHSDWRVPSIAEFQTIIERDVNSNTINDTIFPNSDDGPFWSSTPYVGSGDGARYWYVDFYYGDVTNGIHYSSLPVRRVRSGQSLAIDPYTPSTEFIDNKNGTVIHKRTGLVWQRCSVGQTWTRGTCSGTADSYNYDQATGIRSGLAGHRDWRIPTANELASIVKWGDSLYSSIDINTTVFPNTPVSYFWAFSPESPYNFGTSYASGAWVVDFSDGSVGLAGRKNSFPVRLVRSIQSLAYWPSITVIKNGTGTGTVISKPEGINCGTTCIDGFSSGQKVTLKATPDADSVFVGWSGYCVGTQPSCIAACTGTKPSCTVTVKKGNHVTAEFKSTLN